MRTSCYLCGQTDDDDLLFYGRNEYGWYHRACMRELSWPVPEAWDKYERGGSSS